MVWSYQLVHHDLWDYDIPAQPSDGKERDVVIQGTKLGLVFSKTISLSQIRSRSFRHSSHRPSTTPAPTGALDAHPRPFSLSEVVRFSHGGLGELGQRRRCDGPLGALPAPVEDLDARQAPASALGGDQKPAPRPALPIQSALPS